MNFGIYFMLFSGYVPSMQAIHCYYIAHRDELLEGAIETFNKVFNQPNLCGKMTGQKKEIERKFLFSTIQTLHREENLKKFSPDEFDYIVIDEFHHAQASTYTKVLEYFRPKFLLGLTATPERMDGKDILALCDYNVVYEIRLRDALEADLLCPFHYFGVVDKTVNYDEIPLSQGTLDEQILVKALSTNKRVDYIIEMINRYGYDGDRLIGLGFCVNVEHAKYMSREFNKRGYWTTYLTGEDSPEKRKKIIEQLEDENDPLEIIFTVNIFNEGVDIPKLNLILFLRPTESSTVFIQQLGRGLRKAEGKEFVTILDFIGNYQRSFMIPLALAGQTNNHMFDKDLLRVAVQNEFADLPNGSYVEFDRISKKQILEKLERVRMDSAETLKNFYVQLKKDLGRSPEIKDFLYIEKVPSLYFFLNRFGSWIRTKEKMKDLNEFDQKLLENTYAVEVVERIEQMLPIKWPYELAILELALKKQQVMVEDVVEHLQQRFALEMDIEKHQGLIVQAMAKLASPYKKQNWIFGSIDNHVFYVNDRFIEMVRNDDEIRSYVEERLNYGMIEFRRTFKPEYFLGKNKRLILYQNYTRDDIIFLSESGAKPGSWREGVRRVGEHYFLFVNLKKNETVEEHLRYQDYFIDQSTFHWQSQNQTSHDSSVGQNYIHHKDRGYHIHLFVRKFEKMHGMTLPFTYLGEVDYVESHGDKPMNIIWKLHHPVPDDLFIDLIS
ncbi:DUF3427 domain-containing protein [Thermoflavimicrobium dichotomicum]|uniref:Superfamily II DNA or RNA helicase n=1 Tax=Thermoflavimicrobium dichotomicum TaxID=46223 RepID=A0A1I3JPR7_9BACL|nr:DUF3427 domain-containing protein [Thermoflavimicrobium dichotomicum]SFI62154.1 Superfamily II DNA or RNA helicase [Thermoflavimicrobium dichotomicum]